MQLPVFFIILVSRGNGRDRRKFSLACLTRKAPCCTLLDAGGMIAIQTEQIIIALPPGFPYPPRWTFPSLENRRTEGWYTLCACAYRTRACPCPEGYEHLALGRHFTDMPRSPIFLGGDKVLLDDAISLGLRMKAGRRSLPAHCRTGNAARLYALRPSEIKKALHLISAFISETQLERCSTPI